MGVLRETAVQLRRAQSRAKQIYRLTLGDGVHQSLGQSLRGVDRGTKVSMNAMASQGGFGSLANGGKTAGVELS